MSPFPHQQESVALDEAACRAVDLIHKFAEQDPNDASEDNPWRDPKHIYEQLDVARVQLLEAARALKEAALSTNESGRHDEDYLRAQFMDMITDAFADVLNSMKEDPDMDVNILADCLQSGMDILSQEDREFLLQDMDGGDDEDDETTTPHEARRQDLGYVQTTAA